MTGRLRRRATSLACLLALVAGAGLGSLGCAFGELRPDDPFQRQLTLEDAHRLYTNYVRWNKFGEAAQFVDPELRDEFLAHAPRFRDFRFTDWEATPVVLDDDKQASTIHVTYYGYRTATLVEVPVEEVQEWYRSPDDTVIQNNWLVRPKFESPDLGLAAADRR
jgi:hypothetical protein